VGNGLALAPNTRSDVFSTEVSDTSPHPDSLSLTREHEAEIYRVKGELLLKQNDSNAAEADNCFRRAIEIAQSQSAKSHELRARMSLARLLKNARPALRSGLDAQSSARSTT
jgi:hypothetical protein